jgi:hypothetical protein
MLLINPPTVGVRKSGNCEVRKKSSSVDVGEGGQGAGQLLPGSFVIVHPIVPHLIYLQNLKFVN